MFSCQTVNMVNVICLSDFVQFCTNFVLHKFCQNFEWIFFKVFKKHSENYGLSQQLLLARYGNLLTQSSLRVEWADIYIYPWYSLWTHLSTCCSPLLCGGINSFLVRKTRRLFSTKADVSLSCRLIESALTVRTLDVVWTRQKHTWSDVPIIVWCNLNKTEIGWFESENKKSNSILVTWPLHCLSSNVNER